MQHEQREHRFCIDIVHASAAKVGRDNVRVAFEATKPTCVDLWLPSLAPTDELWQQFSCDDYEWHEFCRRYRLELDQKPSECERLRSAACDCRLTLTYLSGDCRHNVAIAMKQHLQHLECKRRYDAGWIIGGLTWPVREEIERCGGLWFDRHKVWMMPDQKSWKYIHSLLPGDF
jgi:uncharacterized protein YeaO (DUF488 family)